MNIISKDPSDILKQLLLNKGICLNGISSLAYYHCSLNYYNKCEDYPKCSLYDFCLSNRYLANLATARYKYILTIASAELLFELFL